MINTGTSIGLKATPGDMQTRPPQVTLAYKRAELALVPTQGNVAVDCKTETNGCPKCCPAGEDSKVPQDKDAFSTLATFYFRTQWFGDTELDSFIATGHAARAIQTQGSAFGQKFAAATMRAIPDAVKARRSALNQQLGGLGEEGSARTLEILAVPKQHDKNAHDSLQDLIGRTEDPEQLTQIESAVNRAQSENR